MGTTNLGVTTFTLPTVLKQGVGVFVGDDLAAEPGPIGPVRRPPHRKVPPAVLPRRRLQRWTERHSLGCVQRDRRSIRPTPTSSGHSNRSPTPNRRRDTNTWGVQATRITVDFPRRQPERFRSAPRFDAAALGMVGRRHQCRHRQCHARFAELGHAVDQQRRVLSRGRANQATGGATASSLTTQDSGIETVTGLNDVVVMIGENDAVALAQGPQTTTAQSNFVTTIVSEIEGAITNLLAGLPNTDHLVVATIPDVFVTPEIQALGLSSANLLADESAVQEANAQITQFALAKGIPVVDLYGLYNNLLTKPLTIDSTTFSTSTLFAANGLDPAPIVQGLIADAVIDATDLGYASGLAPLSNQTLLADAGDTDTVTGPTFLNLSSYALTPVGAPTTTITATLLSPTGSPTTSTHDVLVNLTLGGAVLGTDYFISGEYFTPGNDADLAAGDLGRSRPDEREHHT